MSAVPRISLLDVQDNLAAGRPLLLVCAYENEARFHKHRLEGAIPLSELRAKLPTLEKTVEIAFY